MDAADPQWHLSSSTPYDPPLTYGGWKQSQALGARIGSIIQGREQASDEPKNVYGNLSSRHLQSTVQGPRPFRRKFRVEIHTSPFLRCIQTSIAISAGLQDFEGNVSAASHLQHGGSQSFPPGHLHLNSSEDWRSPQLSAIPEPEDIPRRAQTPSPSPSSEDATRTLLRIDAFLGEWLSKDYFADVTPPPSSKLMIASAKADLLRPGDPILAVTSSDDQSPGRRRDRLSGGWDSHASASHASRPTSDESTFQNISDLGEALPKLGRAHSQEIGDIPKFKGSNVPEASVENAIGYEPPTPAYAISPSQPIPQGYVAHARDACVKVDYQWDSQRPPLNWGHGGDYGEEWSSMHKRFRKGFSQMLLWYRCHGPVNQTEAAAITDPKRQKSTNEEPANNGDDREVVLILVTHGAGCNALIGALTNQPVLIDVGTASLTMAVRKTVKPRKRSRQDENLPDTHPQRRRSSLDAAISDEYDVKLTASTEHLRPGSKFLNGTRQTRSPSLPIRSKSPYRYERHIAPPHHRSPTPRSPLQDTFSIASDGTTASANNMPIRRSATVSAAASALPSRGLWSRPVPKNVESLEDVNPIIASEAASRTHSESPIAETSDDDDASNDHKTRPKDLDTTTFGGPIDDEGSVNGNNQSPTAHLLSPSGLWGGGAPSKVLSAERDKSSKRRWTLSQA